MTLSREEVLHLAELARIELSEEEVERFCSEIQAILAYVDRLATIDTSKVILDQGVTDHASVGQDVSRPLSREDREALIQAFPDRLGALLRVPGIFENPKKS